ncbi:hypothetical protein BGW37DRAFT_497561 [Umbelopsis sp. PMI_123]|nr:hypothetical protein BGW37DRAFT_497561 [Umbelopsis sp. PMI_123]
MLSAKPPLSSRSFFGACKCPKPPRPFSGLPAGLPLPNSVSAFSVSSLLKLFFILKNDSFAIFGSFIIFYSVYIVDQILHVLAVLAAS